MSIGLTDQQVLLDVFRDSFKETLFSDTFESRLQEIKEALYHRDFAKAFSTTEYLEVYAARYSVGRALCYASAFQRVHDLIQTAVKEPIESGNGAATRNVNPRNDAAEETKLASKADVSGKGAPDDRISKDDVQATRETRKRLRCVSIGGCAAELVGFAHYIQKQDLDGELLLVDSAPWKSVLTILDKQVKLPPSLSKYAAEALKEVNTPLVQKKQLATKVVQSDIFELGEAKLGRLLGKEPILVTIFFTLNELYTVGGTAKTTRLLASLSELMPDKSLLFVVDSPGDYSEASVGKGQKKYPMGWILDHTLLKYKGTTGISWEKVLDNGAVWTRHPDGLRYPTKIENSRYQMHMYRIKSQPGGDNS